MGGGGEELEGRIVAGVGGGCRIGGGSCNRHPVSILNTHSEKNKRHTGAVRHRPVARIALNGVERDMGGRLFGRMDDGRAIHGRGEGRDGGEGLRRGMRVHGDNCRVYSSIEE